jgi:trehalose synthase
MARHAEQSLLDRYAEHAGHDAIEQLRQLARPLTGLKVVHVNSTRQGGGVAEILVKLAPLMQELGMETSWEVIEGNEDFFNCTKSFHNALQGKSLRIPEALLRVYEEVNAVNADRLRPVLRWSS